MMRPSRGLRWWSEREKTDMLGRDLCDVGHLWRETVVVQVGELQCDVFWCSSGGWRRAVCSSSPYVLRLKSFRSDTSD
jgi:hypothetical protein